VGTGSHFAGDDSLQRHRCENATKPKMESAFRSSQIGRHSNLTIVKIGGSLLGSPDLDAWLSVILQSGASVVIVPGGGPFADTVREAQRTIGFDDRTAHHMALLAMDQVAVLLASRSGNAVLATSRAEIDDALTHGRVPVWLPSAMAVSAADLPASWDVTSDSLAAWLAGALAAPRLLLVKSCDVAGPITAQGLADAGIVDSQFPDYAQKAAAEIHIAGPAALAGAGDMVRWDVMPGSAVAL
jgi:aspartokinase-like uncharacterized kinase